MATISFTNYPDDKDDMSAVSIKTVNILIVGLTGSGKSSIIKSICSSEQQSSVQTAVSIHSITKNLKCYQDNLITNPKDPHDRYTVNLFDTVGLGDNDISVSTILQQIVECMPRQLATIHKIVFCFKMDRLRATMSEELNMLHRFFMLLGAKPENFVVCLTFCDILNNITIDKFWKELQNSSDLAMVKEVKNVTYTAFANLEECDDDPHLLKYLTEKARVSRRRVFDAVITTPANPFYPQECMLRMPVVDFDKMCGLLRDYSSRRRWWWGSYKTNQEEMIDQMKKIRSPMIEQLNKDGDDKKEKKSSKK